MSQGTCSVCGLVVPQLRRGMCDPHYRRWKRNGDAGSVEIGPRSKYVSLSAPEQRVDCAADGCDRKAIVLGWCRRCYERWNRTGTTDAPQPKTRCDHGHEFTPGNTYVDPDGKRHCKTCRRTARRRSWAAKAWAICSIPGCGRTAYYNPDGYCQSHLGRFRRYGDPLAGPPIREPKLAPEEKRRRNLARCHGYHLRHQERLNAARRDRYDPAVQLLANRRWRAANPERYREIMYAANAKRRARMKAAGYEFVDRKVVLEAHGMFCHICQTPIASRADLEFDHVIPIARGGSHTYGNVRPSHRTCNRRKGKKLLSEMINAA